LTIVKEGRKYLPEGYDIAQFMRNYDPNKRKESSNSKPKNLTLADLMNRKSSRTFIKDPSSKD
jgi:hypothetical protein